MPYNSFKSQHFPQDQALILLVMYGVPFLFIKQVYFPHFFAYQIHTEDQLCRYLDVHHVCTGSIIGQIKFFSIHKFRGNQWYVSCLEYTENTHPHLKR